jgi:excisionase family DNA binding protein
MVSPLLTQAQGAESLGPSTPLRPADVALLASALKVDTPWLTAKQAASYLCCPLSRVRKLTMTGELPVHREGRRVLYHRDELREFIRDGGAFSP